MVGKGGDSTGKTPLETPGLLGGDQMEFLGSLLYTAIPYPHANQFPLPAARARHGTGS